jgi:hypothetical protein
MTVSNTSPQAEKRKTYKPIPYRIYGAIGECCYLAKCKKRNILSKLQCWNFLPRTSRYGATFFALSTVKLTAMLPRWHDMERGCFVTVWGGGHNEEEQVLLEMLLGALETRRSFTVISAWQHWRNFSSSSGSTVLYGPWPPWWSCPRYFYYVPSATKSLLSIPFHLLRHYQATLIWVFPFSKSLQAERRLPFRKVSFPPLWLDVLAILTFNRRMVAICTIHFNIK